jgi:hypothetical protein
MSPLDPPTESSASVQAKVTAIFRELVGENADHLCSGVYDDIRFRQTTASSLMTEDEFVKERAKDIGFHLSDWHADAAFLVAVHLFPERFTPAEISAGIGNFLVHAPNHVAAAAALYGYPVDDIFEVGALDGPMEDDEEQTDHT